jgi:hypothetical protein
MRKSLWGVAALAALAVTLVLSGAASADRPRENAFRRRPQRARRRRLPASRLLKTSKTMHAKSATAQSFQVPNHSRFGVP